MFSVRFFHILLIISIFECVNTDNSNHIYKTNKNRLRSSLSYILLISKFRASALWSSALQHVRQPQTKDNYSKTQLKMGFTWQLPYGVELQSNINTLLYTGYAERSLSQTSIRWDSSLRKYFELSHGTLAVGFKVCDILNQANYIHTSLDQFSRTEVYANIMPRYALLSLVYMVNWTSKKIIQHYEVYKMTQWIVLHLAYFTFNLMSNFFEGTSSTNLSECTQRNEYDVLTKVNTRKHFSKYAYLLK